MKRLWYVVVVVFLLAVPAGAQSDSGVQYEIDSTYRATKKTVEVSHQIKISSSTPLDEQILNLPGSAGELTVTQDGSKLDFETTQARASFAGVPYAATQAVIDFGSDKEGSIAVEYTADDLQANYVQARNVFAPPFDVNGEITKQSVKLSAPLEGLGGTIIGPEPDDTSSTGGEQTYTFNKDGPIDSPIVLQDGITTTANVTLSAKLENKSLWWSTKTLVFPLDTNQQQSFLKSIKPEPTRVRVDKDGNIIADFRLRPFKTIDVVAKADVVAEQKVYDLETTGTFQQLPAEIVADYTKNTDLWPNSVLDSYELDADTLRKGSVIDAVEKIYTANAEGATTYSEKIDFTKRLGKDGQPQTSLDYSDQLTAALRSAGIPARVVGGVITSNQLSEFETPQNHVWVEAYIPDVGWMTLDPVYGRYSESFFGQVGLERIALFIWGVNDHIPEFEPITADISYSDEALPEEKFTDKAISGTNYLLVPGVSILHSVAQMPAGIIHDEVTVRSKGVEQQLGSLAPLQKIQRLRFVFGGDSWQSQNLNLAIAGDQVAKGTAKVSYLSVIAEVIIILLLGWLMIQLKRKRNAPVVLAKDNSEDYEIEGQNLLHTRASQQNDDN